MKAGYRQTPIGPIPDQWELSVVGREFEIQLGKMLDAEKNRGVPKPYLGNKAVQWNRIEISDLPMVPMSHADLERFRLLPGDLLVCEGGEVGRAAIWEGQIDECYYQKALHRLRPLRGFDPRILIALLHHWSDHGLLANYVTQTSIAHLTREKLAEVPIPVPTHEEQRAIAQALGDTDALLAALKQLIAKKRTLKHGAMQQLFTGHYRLPGFSKEWEANRLGDFGSTYGGLTGKTKADFGVGAGRYIPFLNVMNNVVIDLGQLDLVKIAPMESQNRALKGDLFFNGSSETPEEVGMCAVLLDEVDALYLNSFCFGFRLHANAQVDGLYLAYFFRSPEGRKLLYSLAQGATRYNLSKTALMQENLRIPDLPEQSAIAAVLADTDAELAALKQRLAKTRALKQGMVQELLTGRTRLA